MIYTLMAVVFVLGYLMIALEYNIHVEKAASALLTATILWTLLVFGADTLLADQMVQAAGHVEHAATEVVHGGNAILNEKLRENLAEIAEILFFLMGAMVIVETVDAHDGFSVITNRIKTTNAMKLLWVVGFLAFFLSALLDNLTTTIVMISLLRKLVADQKMRWWYAGMVVVAANAGGAWSPIGDVTTTMLWIGNQITASRIIVDIIVPSIIAAIVPLTVLSLFLRGKTVRRPDPEQLEQAAATAGGHGGHALPEDVDISPRMKMTVLAMGVGALVFVPIFKSITHLPPYMGVLFGLSILWIFTEVMHRHQDWYVRKHVTVVGVLSRVDMPSVMFFMGILLAVASLSTAGHLADAGMWLDDKFGNLYVINMMIGLLSSVVANVPLVAGAMKMYPLLGDAALAGLTGGDLARASQFVQDGEFWHFLAYCAGTGGSCLIIGSAAGIAAMGMEKIPFMWYLKRISWLALIGYLSGAAAYVAIHVM